MIKILRDGDYVLDDVLIRDRSGRDVSQVVSEIITGVKLGGDPTLSTTAGPLTMRTSRRWSCPRRK